MSSCITKLQGIIINSAMRVYQQLGKRYTENIYQKALFYELSLNNLNIDIERNVNVVYTDTSGCKHIISSNRIDLFIHKNNTYNEGNIILELKATKKKIDKTEINQIKKYFTEIKKEDIEVTYGLILNFSQNDEFSHLLVYPDR